MKEGKDGAPSKFVTPRRKKKRRRTDFSNRKARLRREVKRKQALEGNVIGTPVKGHGVVVSSKFGNIRKLVLEPLDESVEEVFEEIREELDMPKGGKSVVNQMSGGKRDSSEQVILSPQPSISRGNSGLVECESKSSEECHSESVSFVSLFDI